MHDLEPYCILSDGILIIIATIVIITETVLIMCNYVG
jgi:hypothetical protein